jgi:hypothetical protein
MEDREQDLISEDSFIEVWGAYVRSTGDLFFFEDVKNQPLDHVWTVTNTGGGTPDHWIAAPGFHVVNALGYVMTRMPWNDTTSDAYYFYDDFDSP